LLNVRPNEENAMIALKHVLVATDFEPASESALAYGRALATAFHGRLSLLHVTDDIVAKLLAAAAASEYLGDIQKAQAELEADTRKRLEALLSDEDRRDLRAQATCLTSNTIAGTIIAHARSSGADLLVLGTHGRGLIGHLVLGSVAEHVVRGAPCPVLTVRHPEHEFVLPDALQTTPGS
jgi:nucleotide-binding universal stress UspA family protein